MHPVDHENFRRAFKPFEMEGTMHPVDHENFRFEADERPTTSLAKFLQAKSNSPDYAEALEAGNRC
eukprot:symbB.v1.2.040725.t1/scaffold7465.1/size11104/1